MYSHTFKNIIQAQRGLPIAFVEKLMQSWKAVGHEEHSLYALCLDKKPEDRNALQARDACRIQYGTIDKE